MECLGFFLLKKAKMVPPSSRERKMKLASHLILTLGTYSFMSSRRLLILPAFNFRDIYQKSQIFTKAFITDAVLINRIYFRLFYNYLESPLNFSRNSNIHITYFLPQIGECWWSGAEILI